MIIFDNYRKPATEFKVKTKTGGFLSLCTMIICSLLFVFELKAYLNISLHDRLSILKDGVIPPFFPLSFDIEFSNISCKDLGLKLVNETNEEVIVQLNSVSASATKNNGCRLRDSYDVSSTKKINLIFFSLKNNKLDHHIHYYSFGKQFPTQLNPLTNYNYNDSLKKNKNVIYKINSIYTSYNFSKSGKNISSFQYSSLPPHTVESNENMIIFKIESVPFYVIKTERNISFLFFILRLCSCIGGVHSLIKMIDLILYRMSKNKRNIVLTLPSYGLDTKKNIFSILFSFFNKNKRHNYNKDEKKNNDETESESESYPIIQK